MTNIMSLTVHDIPWMCTHLVCILRLRLLRESVRWRTSRSESESESESESTESDGKIGPRAPVASACTLVMTSKHWTRQMLTFGNVELLLTFTFISMPSTTTLRGWTSYNPPDASRDLILRATRSTTDCQGRALFRDWGDMDFRCPIQENCASSDLFYIVQYLHIVYRFEDVVLYMSPFRTVSLASAATQP